MMDKFRKMLLILFLYLNTFIVYCETVFRQVVNALMKMI